MAYHLLTGATGLLGQYLLCEALRKRMSMAVVVRPLSGASGRQRIEAVLQRVENQQRRALPRPVVIEGQLDRPGLDLPQPQRQWIAENCGAVIHGAASLTFYADQPRGEPYRSNLTGTRHLLQLCHETGIDQFHYISTAYVCGQRSGRVFEQELDVGQTLGNDYERSKFEAEQLVRQAAFATPPTIYRPSIIVGDSVTGYSSAFHGIYAPLRIFWQLAQQDPGWADPRVPFTSQLDLHGGERKNLVPVDWVAAAIMHIVRHSQHHGQTYHVTHPSPPAVQTIGRAFADAVGACMSSEQASCTTGEQRAPGPAVVGAENKSGELVAPQRSAGGEKDEPRTLTFSGRKAGKRGQEGPAALQAAAPNWATGNKEQLRQRLSVYEAYFRDDPEFDTANLQRAIPHLPCPPIDRDQLLRLAHAAIRGNFGWPRRPPPQLEFDLERELKPLLSVDPLTGVASGNADSSRPTKIRVAGTRPDYVTSDADDLAGCPAGLLDVSHPGRALRRSLDDSPTGARECSVDRLHLELSGPGGGAWTIDFGKGQPISAEPGIGDERGAGVYATVTAFAAIVHGKVSTKRAIRHGRLVITGDPSSFVRVETLLDTLCRNLRSWTKSSSGANGLESGKPEQADPCMKVS